MFCNVFLSTSWIEQGPNQMIRQSNAATSFSVNAKKSISASRSIQITWLASSNLTWYTFAKRVWEVFKTRIHVSHHLWYLKLYVLLWHWEGILEREAFHATFCIFSGEMRKGFLKSQPSGKFSTCPRFFLANFFWHNFSPPSLHFAYFTVIWEKAFWRRIHVGNFQFAPSFLAHFFHNLFVILHISQKALWRRKHVGNFQLAPGGQASSFL